jgi:hypothetical protein
VRWCRRPSRADRPGPARTRSGIVGDVTDTERFLTFEHGYQAGLHSATVVAGQPDLAGPVWPGLLDGDNYPDDLQRNPWLRHGINNEAGEPPAVWRALAWALTEGRSRSVIPGHHRDEVAACLGVDRKAIRLIRQLTDIDRVLAADNASELTVFGLHHAGRRDILAAALNRSDRPEPVTLLEPGEVFVHLAMVREAGAGVASHLTVKTPEANPEVDRLAGHFSQAFRRYRDLAGRIRTLDDFHAAIDDLLAPPPPQSAGSGDSGHAGPLPGQPRP